MTNMVLKTKHRSFLKEIWSIAQLLKKKFLTPSHAFMNLRIMCICLYNNIKHTNPNIITIWLFCEWKCYKNVLLWFWLDKSFEIIHHKQFDRPPTGMGNCAGSSCGEFVSQKDEESLRKIHRSRDLCQKKLQDCTKTLTTTWCFPSKKSEE